jgi:BolA protein
LNNEERLKAIRECLTTALRPEQLEVVDESHQHIGHAGAKTGMGHFAVTIQSPLFADKNLILRHRLIYEALGGLMQTEIHALRITIPQK